MRAPSRAIPAIAASLLLGLASAAPLSAQSVEYTAPGAGAAAPAAPLDKEQLEVRMEEARWDLGPVRLAPYLGVRGLSWVENVFAEEGGGTSDLTASVGAGLTAYLPTGPSLVWVAQAMPEYVWWSDLAERRQVVGRYGAALYGDFNRLTLAVEGRRVEEQAQVTSEEPEPAIGEVEHFGATAALRLTSRLSLAAGAAVAEIANRAGDPDDPRSPALFRLDRRDETARAGLRWQAGDRMRFEAGVERTTIEFEAAARNLSSTGTSPYVAFHLAGNEVALSAEVLHRSLDPEPGSLLPPTESTLGSVRLGLDPGWRFDVGLFARRALLYSLTQAYSHFDEERYGVEVSAPWGRLVNTRAFVEAGGNGYTALAPGAPARDDDALAYGLEVSLKLREWLTYRAGYRRLELDSNLPGLDRDTESVLSTVSLTTGSWIWQ
jgi:hypothetical protein